MAGALVIALWLVAAALAGAPEDLALASDVGASQQARMEAFDRLVALGATDIGLVTGVAGRADADARQRWVAARVLGKVGGDRARETLLALLADDMPAMRAAAAQALGDLGDRTTALRVAQALEDPAVMVRAAAAEALGKLREPTTVDALDRALSSSDGFYRGNSLWVRRHYVEALGRIGSDSALPALLRCLDDGDEAVVAEAVLAFEQVAGFSFAEGRDLPEQREAWRRYAQTRLK